MIPSIKYSQLNNGINLHYFIFIWLYLGFFVTACSSDDPGAGGATGVQGTVMDELGNFYPNVTMTLQPGNINAVTDNDGNYNFNNLSAGDFEIFITPPNASEIPAGTSTSITLNEGQTQTVNFTVRILPVDAVLALGENDPEAHIRNLSGGIPEDPDELLYKPFGGDFYPILAPDGHHITLEEWSTAQATSIISCNGSTTNYSLTMTGLIPNGVYTVWNFIYASSKKPGNDVIGNIAGGPLGPSDGSKNAFTASETGSASLDFGVSGGEQLSFGNQPNCAITDAGGSIMVILYHIDGQTYGPQDGPGETIADHMLVFY